ncbi:MAG: hypothetical protein KJ061_03615 [Vicinamibacteraceae bacterium]|nr:hypothetical protein [Vicinamibacteraceae bacterium]
MRRDEWWHAGDRVPGRALAAEIGRKTEQKPPSFRLDQQADNGKDGWIMFNFDWTFSGTAEYFVGALLAFAMVVTLFV